MFQILKNNRKNDAQYMTRYTLLLDDLARTKSDLDSAYANFENVVDPDLIDASIYEVKAVQMRYKFLLSCVKEENLHQVCPSGVPLADFMQDMETK